MVALSPESASAVFAQPRPDGGFDGQVRVHLRQLGRRRPVVLLAFPPKAAGTYFRTAVVWAVEGQLVRAVHAQGGRDAQLYLPTFVSYYAGAVTTLNMVAHVHMQALPANIQFLEMFDIRPIVMTRSIPDMLASYWDMLENDPEARKDGLNCLIPPDFCDMPERAKADFLIDILGPWYASYFATWYRYAESDPDRVCMLAYDEFRDEPADTLMRAVAHARLPRSFEQCRAALDRAWGMRDKCRYNKAESGRGELYFEAEHIARLERMLRAYRVLAPHTAHLLPQRRPMLAQAV